MIKYIKSENFEEELMNSKSVVLADFFAKWCGPCQMLGPVLEKIAEKSNNFDIFKIDIDEAEELAIKYEIEVVPTMMIFKNGKCVETMQGYLSEEEILQKVSKYTKE